MKNFIIYIIITLSLIAGVSYAAETIIDISSQTNLTAGDHITLNDDELDVADDWWDALTDMVLTDTYIYVGNASNDPVGVTMSNDCTISNTGAITCDHDALDNYLAAEHIDWTATTSVFEGWGDHSLVGYLTTVTPENLTANATTDEYILTYEADSNSFVWEADTDTTYTAGNYLTLDGTEFDLDPELATSSITIMSEATTSYNGQYQHSFPYAVTITKVKASTDGAGTTTFQLDERAEDTPNVVGTDIMTSALVAGTTLASTTAFGNAGIAAGAWISLDIDSISSTNATSMVRVNITYYVND